MTEEFEAIYFGNPIHDLIRPRLRENIPRFIYLKHATVERAQNKSFLNKHIVEIHLFFGSLEFINAVTDAHSLDSLQQNC